MEGMRRLSSPSRRGLTARRPAHIGTRVPRRARLTAIGSVILLAVGCDLSVTNPGPVEDRFLNDADAHLALVNGSQRALSYALNRVNFYALVVAREMIASGGLANRGHSSDVGERGFLNYEEGNVNAKWAAAHQARWQSEEAIRRIKASGEEGFSTSTLGARALVYAGFANRLLGENMCFAVIDNGPAEPHTVHLTRAEQQFTEAIAVAEAANEPDLMNAALAGIATVRAHLGKWSEAIADATAVPTDFVFVAPNHSTSQDENNKIVDANLAAPWRSLSVHSTWFEDYYRETGDPRTPFGMDPEFPMGDGRPVPWLFELKYKRDRSAPIDLATGTEMQLIRAEGALRAGDWQGALALINEVHTSYSSDLTGGPLAAWEASSAEETWTALKLERAIDLWIEGRMLGYHRSWIENSTPGPLPPEFDMTGRSLCFPIPLDERRTNPNIPLAPEE